MSSIRIKARPDTWGGDPRRKQDSIATARAALAATPLVMCAGRPLLAAADQPGRLSDVYCAAFGTADPTEFEARSGLPLSLLMLVSGTLSACEYWRRSPAAGNQPQVVAAEAGAPLAMLEAIPLGADPISIARHYVVDLLGRLAAIRGHDGPGLTPEQQSLVSEMAKLHAAGSTDPVAFRALRIAAVSAVNEANGQLEATVLRFAESVAWPLAGLVGELPDLAARVHVELRSLLSPERPTASEQAAIDASDAVHQQAWDRFAAGAGPEEQAAIVEEVRVAPEIAAVDAPEFQARLDHYDRVAAESYAPFAVGLLLEAFRKAA